VSLVSYIQSQKSEVISAKLLLSYLKTNPFDVETQSRIIELARLDTDTDFFLRIPPLIVESADLANGESSHFQAKRSVDTGEQKARENRLRLAVQYIQRADRGQVKDGIATYPGTKSKDTYISQEFCDKHLSSPQPRSGEKDTESDAIEKFRERFQTQRIQTSTLLVYTEANFHRLQKELETRQSEFNTIHLALSNIAKQKKTIVRSIVFTSKECLNMITVTRPNSREQVEHTRSYLRYCVIELDSQFWINHFVSSVFQRDERLPGQFTPINLPNTSLDPQTFYQLE
jgi:hypothetical protein